MSNESKDTEYTALRVHAAEVDRDFHEALNNLRALASDYSEGSQQRFLKQIRRVMVFRDELWYTQQRLNKLDQE